MRKLLLGLMIGAAAALPTHAQSVRAGIDAWQKGDTAQAVAIWRPLAEKGDADAAFNLGQAYRLGRGVNLDLAQAQTWLERAARKGHVDAQTTLGLLLFQNGNQTAGMRWLNGAAEAGEPRALLMVGTALYNGDGITRDPVRAYAYVSRAAAQGLAPAKATLADMDEVMPIEQRREGVALAQSMLNRRLASETNELAAARPSAGKPAPPKVAQAKPPIAKPGPSKPAAAPPAKPLAAAASGRWRVQLGAFSQRKSGEALYAKLSGKLSGKQAYYVPAGAVIRLQAGPFESRAAASAACGRLAPQPCFPVEAR
jgi:cell division septation protein DedD